MVSHVGRRTAAARIAAEAVTPLVGFAQVKHAVAAQFQRMSAHELFRTTVDKDSLWDSYLASFPEGSNPMFRKRREHDCSCCRQFVRAVGNVVAIIDGELTSLWDIEVPNPAYQAVGDAVAALVKGQPIDNRFLHIEGKAGTDRNFEAGDMVKTWEHFFVNIPNSRVCKGVDIGPRLSESRALHDVLLRSLTELTMESVDTTLELIAQNSLYRGEEHRHAIAAFKATKVEFDRLALDKRDPFVWLKTGELPGAVSKIRNTSIGQLLTDLSEGRDLEGAVRAFETMVAPANYRRPTALVTKAMVDRARAAVDGLGLTSALERRYATLRDVSVNNVLFADRSARTVMRDSVFDQIATSTPAVRPDGAEISADAFLAEIVPTAQSLEAFVENRHASNFVSLVAPAEDASAPLFKWNSRLSWSYAGDFADSIRERVKQAGGNVTGDLCCRLGWYNYDDLDFHMMEPGRYEIYFGNKTYRSPAGGTLDVDMNAGGGHTRQPVENIVYPSVGTMREGTYRLFVHQYSKRESKDLGFEVEIDALGQVYAFAYGKAVAGVVAVADVEYSRRDGLKVVPLLPASTTRKSRKLWEIGTEGFHRVNVVMLSPNHWDGQGVGNRHWFFMLDGCRNDGSARGFYNEFLRSDLDQHRKVLELVGSKMRTEESGDQLSGLGFSSTQRNHLLVRVNGGRTLKVMF
jgi:hypothetical protein